MGKSGYSALKLLIKKKIQVWAINSGKIKNWPQTQEIQKIVAQENLIEQESNLCEEIFSKMDLIIISPGIPRDHNVLKMALAKKIPVISEIELAYTWLKSQCKIVAITGTNGKTTTTTLLGDILKNDGRNVFVGGNIGVPLSDLICHETQHLNTEIVVLELSSFQLESMVNFHPHLAAIVNINMSHGERYKNLESYASAKFHIADNMNKNDSLLIPDNDPMIIDWAQGQHSTIYKKNIVNLKNNFDLTFWKLKGEHNLENLWFASTLAQLLGVDKKSIQQSINQFPGLPHRVEKVLTNLSYEVFNDSKSTNILSTFVALKSMEQEKRPLYLIIGGKFRAGVPDDSLITYVDELQKYCDKILLIGETTDFLFGDFGHHISCQKLYDLEHVKDFLAREKFLGTLLFSPAFPSFDQFENYVHRGDYFKKIFS